MEKDKRFEGALYGISDRLRRVLEFIPPKIQNSVQEIRIRSGLPVTLTICGETVFVLNNGQTSFYVTSDVLIANKSDVDESFKLLCRNSAFAHSDELRNGYIVMKNGNRAGVCGTVTENGMFNNISSINIRIAREIYGAANDIIPFYHGGGLLIAGPPGSGKTTILRDLIRQISDGVDGHNYRVVVIDSRGEISGSSNGVSVNNLGRNTDILMTKNKAAGMEIAVRTMFPDIVAFDEIGTALELSGVQESLCAGVSVIATAHVGCVGDLLRRSVTSELIMSGAINDIVVLPKLHGGKITVIKPKELYSETVS